MDDHKVSMAGVQNGIFNGPNDADALAKSGVSYQKTRTLVVHESVSSSREQREPVSPWCYGSTATQCLDDKKRRKDNFLKLESAYFFISPEDGTITPWQSSIFGRYSEVNSVEEIETNFSELTVVDMKDTVEYTNDTFGLRSLDERGG